MHNHKRQWRMNPTWYMATKQEPLFPGTKPTLTLYERQVMTQAVIYAVGQYHEYGDDLPHVKDVKAYKLHIENKLCDGIDALTLVPGSDEIIKAAKVKLSALPDMILTQNEAVIHARESMKRMTIHTFGSSHKNHAPMMMEQFKYLAGIIS